MDNVIPEVDLEKKEIQKKAISAVIKLLSTTLKRYKGIKDPSTRYSIILDHYITLIDAGLAVSEFFIPKEYGLERELKETTDEFRSFLTELFEWVQNPVYQPDHPIGKQILNDAKKEFDTFSKNKGN